MEKPDLDKTSHGIKPSEKKIGSPSTIAEEESPNTGTGAAEARSSSSTLAGSASALLVNVTNARPPVVRVKSRFRF